MYCSEATAYEHPEEHSGETWSPTKIRPEATTPADPAATTGPSIASTTTCWTGRASGHECGSDQKTERRRSDPTAGSAVHGTPAAGRDSHWLAPSPSTASRTIDPVDPIDPETSNITAAGFTPTESTCAATSYVPAATECFRAITDTQSHPSQDHALLPAVKAPPTTAFFFVAASPPHPTTPSHMGPFLEHSTAAYQYVVDGQPVRH
jgi:hypothetical protein